MIVTCDIVESAAASSNQMFAEIDFNLSTTGFGKSFATWVISALLVSSAVASDSIDTEPVGFLVDTAVASDVYLSQSSLNTLVVERAVASDSLTRVADAMIVETARCTDIMRGVRAIMFSDSAEASDGFVNSAEVSALLVSRAVARDALFGFGDLDIVDSATARDTLFTATEYTALLVSAGVADDELLVDGEYADMIVDRAVGASDAFSTLDAFTMLIDSAVARDQIVLQLGSMAWVMNTETFAMARYTSLPFKSMAMVGGRVLGLGDGGLYEMTGDTDLGLPVNASVTTGRSMLGTSSVKRLPYVYITGAVAGQLDLTAVVYGVHKGAFTYSLVARESDAPRGHRVQLGRGLASVYWKFIIANKDGARFDIDTIMADVAASTTRRI